MHEPHFFLDRVPDSDEILLDGENHHHLRNVLRLREGDRVVLMDRSRDRARCEVRDISRDSTRVSVGSRFRVVPPGIEMSLAQAFLQPQKMELILQKAAEWAVARLVPLRTRRSRAVSADRAARWQRVAVEAACQSEAPVVLEVAPEQTLADFLACEGPGLILDECGGAPLRELLAAPAPREIKVLVGPEGGWDREEVQQALQAGFVRASLGDRNLRAETAAISAVALLMHHWGMNPPACARPADPTIGPDPSPADKS